MKGREAALDIIGQQRDNIVRIACWENDKRYKQGLARTTSSP
jgi:hypothetical protein